MKNNLKPIFFPSQKIMHQDLEATICMVITRCDCCKQEMPEPFYMIKYDDGRLKVNIPESALHKIDSL